MLEAGDILYEFLPDGAWAYLLKERWSAASWSAARSAGWVCDTMGVRGGEVVSRAGQRFSDLYLSKWARARERGP